VLPEHSTPHAGPTMAKLPAACREVLHAP
jgi:hypothetical protein